jgi:hypothetical protein
VRAGNAVGGVALAACPVVLLALAMHQGVGVGGSSLPQTGPIAETSLADVQSRLVLRLALTSDDALRLAERLPLLRRRYNEQLQRAKIQFVDPRLKLSSCRSLLFVARAIASVSQLLYQALNRAEAAGSVPQQPTVATEILEEALAWNECQLGRIGSQLQALDFADTQSAWLKTLLDQLESSSRVSSSDWTRLARDVMSSTILRPESGGAILMPGVPLKTYFAEVGHVRHAEALARGVEAAQLVVRLLNGRVGLRCDVELLTVAALSQDCGLLLCQPRTESMIRPVHGAVGAGLVAGIIDYSTELPSLVGQHHRRLNEPQLGSSSYARGQNTDSRLLAVVVRWLELVDGIGSPGDETPLAASRLALAEPARRLLTESLRGDWDRRLAADLLVELGCDSEAERLRDAERSIGVSNRKEPQRRLDSADEDWRQPNLPSAEVAPTSLGRSPRSRELKHARAVAK